MRLSVHQIYFNLYHFSTAYIHTGGAVSEWARTLAWTGDRVVLAGFESRCAIFASEL